MNVGVRGSSAITGTATGGSSIATIDASGGTGGSNTVTVSPKATTGNSGQTNASGKSNGGGNSGNGTANTGQQSSNVVTPPPGGPAHPTASGTALADETSVASGSGLALDNSVSSGDAVALHGSVASGCSVAIDHSTSSGGTCHPAHGAASTPSRSGGNAAGGRALAFTGMETLQLSLAGALALALGALLVAFAGLGRREEATA